MESNTCEYAYDTSVQVGAHLLAGPYANSLIMLYWVRYRDESRIPNPNTKASDILPLEMFIIKVLGLVIRGPNLRFLSVWVRIRVYNSL